MTANKEDIQRWINTAIQNQHTHIISVCDTFSYDDYPVFCTGETELAEKKKKYENGANMQRINEVIIVADHTPKPQLIVEKIEPQTIEAFNPDGTSLGFINLFEFNALRIQCMENKLSGYYMFFNGEKIFINEDGTTDGQPKGFYSMIEDQLRYLVFKKKPEESVVDTSNDKCQSCGHPRNNHPFRHMFVEKQYGDGERG